MLLSLFLGAFMILYAISHAMKSTFLLGKRAKKMDTDARHKYQKGLVAPFLALGIIFICIAFATEAQIIGTTLFVVLFIVLVLPIVIWIFVYDKKHVG
ncbi:hypothetical protein [Evansella cellulosilytica]|uniref:DUF3784 domain-containing protein n=1 Tax=Evansella cellulosilytica (strain ATCC 21833 / DSM 2522 / FERM P-1141 / JCM 9156 / N-4) TaxID=649639 RepID=E6TR04_EVAC2|nr:hypothetical protein [Evansella cellulosilytica]ADU29380.1 hypothetical protein Bcell_1110 [Evansella cellulosilytica DSM 2522]